MCEHRLSLQSFIQITVFVCDAPKSRMFWPWKHEEFFQNSKLYSNSGWRKFRLEEKCKLPKECLQSWSSWRSSSSALICIIVVVFCLSLGIVFAQKIIKNHWKWTFNRSLTWTIWRWWRRRRKKDTNWRRSPRSVFVCWFVYVCIQALIRPHTEIMLIFGYTSLHVLQFICLAFSLSLSLFLYQETNIW